MQRMVTRRRVVMALGVGALAPLATLAPLVSFAQQHGKVWRIGLLGVADAASYADRVEGLRTGLRALGYVEGQNIAIEFRWADGNSERLTANAAELARQKVDLIVTHATPGSRAAMLATTDIPIVMSVGDAIASGIVSNLARPGGNVTGFTFFQQELIGKRIEIAKELSPSGRRIGILLNPDSTNTPPFAKFIQNHAKILKIDVHTFEARSAREIGDAFEVMAKARFGAAVFFENSIFVANRRAFANSARKYRMPAVGNPEFAESGGMIGYGPDIVDLWRRKAVLIDKIFKGAKPSDLPIEQPTKFEMVFNMKTAKALGIKIPNSILVRATKVIE